jgi:hypothetical protein
MALVDKWAWKDLPEDQRSAFQVEARTQGCLLVRLR